MKFAKIEQEKEVRQQEVSSLPETEEKKQMDNTTYIDMDLLRPNSKNEYQMSEIEKLSGMIRLAGGIWQNLIVEPADQEGYYTITTGERRWRAAQLLKENGEYPKQFKNKVPCTIRRTEEIDLPLSKDLKEDFAIMVTNQYRKKTDGELLMEMKKWREIIKELRDAGMETLPLGFGEGEDGERKLKGVPTRTLVAEQLGVSTGQVSRLEQVEKRGSDKLLNMLIEDKMDLAAAEKMIKLKKEKQTALLEELPLEDSEETNRKVGAVLQQQEVKVKIKKSVIKEELEELVSGVNDKIELTQGQYKKYQKLIGQLKTILSE